jgi:hypothetical protein
MLVQVLIARSQIRLTQRRHHQKKSVESHRRFFDDSSLFLSSVKLVVDVYGCGAYFWEFINRVSGFYIAPN